MKGLAQEQTSLQAHALQFPFMAARNNDNGRVSGLAMAAQNLVKRDAIEIGQTHIQQNQVRAQFGQTHPGILAIVKKVQTPAPIALQYISKQADELSIIFDDGYQLALLNLLLPINNHG